MYILTHNNDGKEKWQSHTVTLQAKDISEYPADFSIYGYGSTKEDAINEFKENFDVAISQINDFYKEIDYSNIVEVDCCGEILK